MLQPLLNQLINQSSMLYRNYHWTLKEINKLDNDWIILFKKTFETESLSYWIILHSSNFSTDSKEINS